MKIALTVIANLAELMSEEVQAVMDSGKITGWPIGFDTHFIPYLYLQKLPSQRAFRTTLHQLLGGILRSILSLSIRIRIIRTQDRKSVV